MSMYGRPGADNVISDFGPSMTRQSMKDECDINNILKRYIKSGLLAHVNSKPMVYADVSDVKDYREALDRVRGANEFFAGLPAKIRGEFKNDPAVFLDFMSNPANEAKARELGLIPAAPEAGPGAAAAAAGAAVAAPGAPALATGGMFGPARP